MELRGMRSLTLLDELGSIQAVAESCHLSAAAVHQHLKLLSQEVGVPVYSQDQGRLRLTEAGRLILPFAKEVLAQHEAANAAILEWRDAKRGLVRVGAGPSFCSLLLPSLIKRFRRKCPGIDVFVEAGSTNLDGRLRRGALDLIFHPASGAASSDQFEEVARWDSPAAIVGSVQHAPEVCSIRDLQKMRFILYEHDVPIQPDIQRYLDGLHIRPKIVMRSDSAEAIKSMITAGLGVSVMLLWSITADPRRAAFRVIRTNARPLPFNLVLLKLRSSFTSRAVMEFIKVASTTGS